eukprot:778704-Pelagomonas_calceolata.AAC.1
MAMYEYQDQALQEAPLEFCLILSCQLSLLSCALHAVAPLSSPERLGWHDTSCLMADGLIIPPVSFPPHTSLLMGHF